MQIKFSFFILFTIYLLALSLPNGLFTIGQSSAQTPTETQGTTIPTDSNIINDLKERIASRVAELKLVERRGILGIVTEVKNTQITVSDAKGNTRFIDVDELTKFSSPSAKEDESFGISDIKTGNKIGVLGLYNKQSKRILARFVDVVTIPSVINATVISADEDNFTVNIISDNKEIFTVDIEKITKTNSYTKAEGLEKSGFSEIEKEQHIVVVGFLDLKDKKRITASRFIVFPNVPKNPSIQIPKEIADDETVVSTGGGKKLTPLTR